MGLSWATDGGRSVALRECDEGRLDIIAVSPVHTAKCNRALRLGLQVALGRVRRKPATARISGERDVMQIGVAGFVPGWPC